MSAMCELFVLVPRGISRGVFVSQVLSRFQLVHELPIRFVAARWLDTLIDSNVYSRCSWGQFLLQLFVKRRRLIVYSRSAQQVLVMLLIKVLGVSRPHIVFDLRGFQAEESALRRRGAKGPRYWVLSIVERLAIRFADKVTCVSQNMADEIGVRYARGNVVVVPCCIPEEKLHRRLPKRWPVKGSLRFAYVGSIAAWQCFDEAIRLFKGVEGAKELHIVTPDIEKARNVLLNEGIDANVQSGSWAVVEEVLDKCDYGFVLRQRSVVNITASPIKFLEYAARGVIPICTAWVGDFARTFEDCSLSVGEHEALPSEENLRAYITQGRLDALYSRSSQHTWRQYRGCILDSVVP